MKRLKLAMLAVAAVSMFSFMACSTSDNENSVESGGDSNEKKPGEKGDSSTPPRMKFLL